MTAKRRSNNTSNNGKQSSTNVRKNTPPKENYNRGYSPNNKDDFFNDNHNSEPGFNTHSKNPSGYDRPINDPPYDDYDEPSNNSFSKNPSNNNTNPDYSENNDYANNSNNNYSKEDHEDADMVFTEEDVYGNSNHYSEDSSPRDEMYDNHDSDEEHHNIAPLAQISSSQASRARRRMHIPENGFSVTARGRNIRKDIEIERINQLLERLQDNDVVEHIRQSVRLFTNDSDSRSRQDNIDIAFVLAVAIRESGVRTALARSNRRIVTAGRDAHTQGRSGLDWVYDYKRFFPSTIRNQVHPVVGNSQVPGEFRRDVHPAYLRERDLICAFIVEIRQRHRRFLRRFNRHEFSNGFSEQQRNALLSSMSNDAKRAWIQAAFGSKIHDLLMATKDLIQTASRNGTSFNEIVENDNINLNAIITNDSIMPRNLSRQRTRISAAEALLVEEAINNLF